MVLRLQIALRGGHAIESSFCDWLVTATSRKEVVFLRTSLEASRKVKRQAELLLLFISTHFFIIRLGEVS